MVVPASPLILLIGSKQVRHAPVWNALKDMQIHAYGHREFKVATHLSSDTTILLYQVTASFAQTLQFLGTVTRVQSDLCVMLFGKNIHADHVAQFLRHGAFDYLAWPCSVARLKESLIRGLANRRAFPEVRNLSGELARTNHSLTQDRRILTQCSCNLSGLHQLTQSIASFIGIDAVVKELLSGLPRLIAVDVIGLARTNPEQGWTWSCDHDLKREESVRRQLLAALGHTPQRMTSSHAVLRLVRSVHEIPDHVSPQMPSGSKRGSVSTHEVPLAIGPYGTGILYLERDAKHPFTEQERQLLAIVGASLALTLRNADSYQRLQDVALQDSLTGVLNRRGLNTPLARELKAGLRYGVPACLILLDFDFFQTVNDRLGHKIGDHVLRAAADLIRMTVREIDIVGRHRGNTFAVVLPHTDRQQARALAERLRDRIERHPFAIETGQVRTTASIGLTAVPDATVASIAEWMMICEAALNDAKAQGRNRVVLHAPKPPALACAVALSCAA